MPRQRPAANVTYTKPIRIKLEGMITILTHEYMKRQLDRAKELGADLVIVEIDSPGGDAQSSIDIAEDLAAIKWARTVAYVEKQAISGGAFVALGCEEIVLSPTARIGDAGPIVMGADSQFRHAPEKNRQLPSRLRPNHRRIATTSPSHCRGDGRQIPHRLSLSPP